MDMGRLAGLFLAGALLVGGRDASGETLTDRASLPRILDDITTSELSAPSPGPDLSLTSPPLGTYTTLSGYWDYQVNGGSAQYIRVNPTNGNIHVVMMVSDDSLNTSASRRTAYAFSSDGGQTWNNFSQIRIPESRSGYPTLDLLRAPNEGLPVIANHGGAITQSQLSVDQSEGGGVFGQLPGIPILGGSDEPIWPSIAATMDGALVMHASRSTAGTNHITRTADFTTWSPWIQPSGPSGAGGTDPVVVSNSGRVATIIVQFINGAYVHESTDNGVTWNSGVEIYPPLRVVNGDTIAAISTYDIIYDGDNLLAAIAASRPSPPNSAFFAGSRIDFWSDATGIVTAVSWDSVKYPSLMVVQGGHWPLGNPVLAKSGATLVMAYVAFTSDTANVDSTSGRIFGDIWYVTSVDNGATWSDPTNLTDTPQLDERYPSVSRWNPDGSVHLVWQEDIFAGTWVATPDPGTPGSRCRQVYYRLDLDATGVKGRDTQSPTKVVLKQNFPNPFNPATTIQFSIVNPQYTIVKVYDMLGREVETLVNEVKQPGTYTVQFDARLRSANSGGQGSGLGSGVYLYRIEAGDFRQTRRMVFLK
jgi:hypothetical protein